MKQHLTMKELPVSERPYEKLVQNGPESLSDAELLAIVIRSGAAGRKAIDVAQSFLSEGKGNLLNLYDMSFDEMKQIPGIGKIKAIQLKTIAELSKRIAQTKYGCGVQLNSAHSIATYYMERMRHEKQELLLLCMFDSKCRLIDDAILSKGSATATIVPPREIFLTALQANAVHIVLLHNHPSGVPAPSAEDDSITMRLIECGKMLGISVSDHIIIGDQLYYSYREQNRIF